MARIRNVYKPGIWGNTMGTYKISLGEKGGPGTEAMILENSRLLKDREVGFKEQRSRKIMEEKRGGSFKKKRLKIESGSLTEWF